MASAISGFFLHELKKPWWYIHHDGLSKLTFHGWLMVTLLSLLVLWILPLGDMTFKWAPFEPEEETKPEEKA